MLKKDIVEMVKAELGTTFTQADKALEAVLNAIVEGCILHGEVKLRKFGHFAVKELAGKTVVVPTTKETITVPPKKVIKFRASRAIYGL